MAVVRNRRGIGTNSKPRGKPKFQNQVHICDHSSMTRIGQRDRTALTAEKLGGSGRPMKVILYDSYSCSEKFLRGVLKLTPWCTFRVRSF